MSDTATQAETTNTAIVPDDTLIDDIAAEYPDLAGGGEGQHAEEDTEMVPPGSAQEQGMHQSDLELDDSATQHHGHEMGVDELAGDVEVEEEGGLTDEALRQFANAAALHYDLNHHEHEQHDDHEHQQHDDHEHQQHQDEEQIQQDHHHHEQGVPTDGNGGETEQLDPSLAQVVTGSIPPPPRPTYHQHQQLHPHSTTQTVAETTTTTTGEKRKRDEYDPATLSSISVGGEAPEHPQPIQAQADPLQHPLLPLQHRHMILPRASAANDAEQQGSEKTSPLAPGGSLPMSGMYPSSRGSHPSLVSQPQQNQAPIQTSSNTRSRKSAASSSSAAGGGGGAASGRGRVRSQGVASVAAGAEDMMHLTDGGGGEGSDGGTGRKEGKDERSARRAEQNRRAQQNFRKRREEAMKEQAARLEILIPQMDEMKRQQAETQLLLEALKLENTALRAVLVQAVKEGAKILDDSGELLGASTMALGGSGGAGNPFPHAHPHPRGSAADGTDTIGETADDAEEATSTATMSEETAKAVQDVYAALDRLGARTHVYARTIVPLVTPEEQQQQDGQQTGGFAAPHTSHHFPPGLSGPTGPSSVSTTRRYTQGKGMQLHHVGQSVQHQPTIAQSSIRTAPHQPSAQASPYEPTSSYGFNNMQNLPPFPGSGSGVSQNGRSNANVNANPPGSASSAVSEQMRAVEEAIAEIDPALQVASVASAVPEPHHAVGSGNEVEGEDEGQDEMMVDPSIDVSLS
ncbi:hypothetical protein QFC21_006028 [Naganishia friedmannii]|uniref:Uncharacterized protein n=1 Tax=Naganishia friedmannii TaxID=89922 RepID=A0ACC2V5P8_9TREE|nr:hypothetical protein QFC21_006028 [Naganishia friedmannii]